MGEITTSAVCNTVGIKRSRLQGWFDRGLVKPSVTAFNGTGARNIYSETDIHKIWTLKHLIDHGIAATTASEFINNPNWKKGEPFVIKCDTYCLI